MLFVYSKNGDIEAFDVLNLQRIWTFNVES